ncbi:nudC domain-containing protein 1 [Brevipalpus obovatus]|uniref:nudC domain-containing protein 1 n=1 Tax=Brevipalpus obovatus TaxID=246614 RepID=UPI003D9E07F2
MTSMDNATVQLDLRVNHDLIDSKFECYRLSGDELPVQSVQLTIDVDQLTLEDKQLYGLLHHTAFYQCINYLFEDPFHGDNIENVCCYFVDRELNINSIEVINDDNTLETKCCLQLADQMKHYSSSSSRDCLVTISFPTDNLALVLFSQSSIAGGEGEKIELLVINTGDRQFHKDWKVVHKFNLLDQTIYPQPSDNIDCGQVVTIHSPCKIISSNSGSQSDDIQVIILSLTKNHDDKFECLLSNIFLCQKEGLPESEWTVQRLLQLSSPSYPLYIGSDFREKSCVMCAVSEKQFKFLFDSRSRLEMSTETETKDDGVLYTFYQSEGMINIDFKLSSDIEAKHIKINFGPRNLSIYVRNEKVFDEELWEAIYPDDCSWTLEKGSRKKSEEESVLQLTLVKQEEDFTWDQLIKGEDRGVQLFDDAETKLNALSYLAGSLKLSSEPKYIPSLRGSEQCDEVTQDLAFTCYDCGSKRISYQMNLAGHQWLFEGLQSTKLPCFSVRHDVDALILLPSISGRELKINHIATFPALGYVQASKQSKRFLNCSPDFEYAFLADYTNHVYIYKQPELDPTLRNRKVQAKSKVAKQKVVNLGREPVIIIGAIAYHRRLILLSKSKLFCVHVAFE